MKVSCLHSDKKGRNHLMEIVEFEVSKAALVYKRKKKTLTPSREGENLSTEASGEAEN